MNSTKVINIAVELSKLLSDYIKEENLQENQDELYLAISHFLPRITLINISNGKISRENFEKEIGKLKTAFTNDYNYEKN